MARNETRYREAERRFWESLGVSPTERRLALPHTGATVRIQEVGEGPAVLFVHGGSTSGASWAPLVAQLQDFRCIVLDRPGCGLSDPLATHFDDVDRLATFAEALLVDVLDALDLDLAHLVATSFGGYIALRTAAAHPDRVRRMVEFGWTIGAPTAGFPAAMRITSVPFLGRLMAAIPPNAFAVRAIYRQLGLGPALEDGRISPEGFDWFLSLLRDTPTMRNELAAGPRFINPIRGQNERILLSDSLLASVQAPLFFLWGEKDPLGGPEVARRFAARLSDAELEILPGASHAPWIDDVQHAAEITRKFLGV